MTKNLYVVFDNISQEVATTIIISENDETITRNLQDAQLPDTMEKHPEDFDIIKIGAFDTQTCEIVPCNKLVCHLGALKHGKE